MDTCCPKHTFKHNLTEWIDRVNDTLPRIPCDIDPADFHRDYVLPRVPVMLTGCTKGWPAEEKWSLERLLLRYGGDVRWKCDVSLKDDSPITMEMLRESACYLSYRQIPMLTCNKKKKSRFARK